jgi:hypothetical protein
MFERAIDWPKAVAMMGDIAKGTASISMRLYARKGGRSGAAVDVTGWDYHQVQAHGGGGSRLSALVEPQHLERTLSGIARLGSDFYAYEVARGTPCEAEARQLVLEFADITIGIVKLGVGDVAITWFLVAVHESRDLIHWKMQYHERNRRPGQTAD